MVSVDGTFSDEYFEVNPLARVSIAQTAFLTVSGQQESEFAAGETVQISSTIRNHQRDSQSYVFIVQILDEEGVAQSISWSAGMLERAQSHSLGHSWLAEEAGNYQVRIYVWNGLDAPEALSAVSARVLQVSEGFPSEFA
jgi:hypothetical protein